MNEKLIIMKSANFLQSSHGDKNYLSLISPIVSLFRPDIFVVVGDLQLYCRHRVCIAVLSQVLEEELVDVPVLHQTLGQVL